MRDHYEILGVAPGATPEEIKKAYHRIAHRYHPDKNPGDKIAEDRFKEATAAWNVLNNPIKRRNYDRFESRARRAAASGVGDLFGDLFGDMLSNKTKKSGKQRGDDTQDFLKISFFKAINGAEESIEVSRHERCGACTGTGSQPGSSPQICYACGGSGEVRIQQGILSVGKRCTYCEGKGKIIGTPCKDCKGQGQKTRQTRLRVRIPPGTQDGTILRYAGEGEPGKAGGAPGDLRVEIQIEKHPIFLRQGSDIHLTLPITPFDAALGAEIDVPTLDGSVKMSLPPGTQTGKILRLRGKGVTKKSGKTKGDLLVEVLVETPSRLSEGESQLLRSLQKLTEEHYPARQSFWKDMRENR
ncbi:molecular chaperone DnaJ [Myxococcota bacterium]|nr:molecular chaperone DnaJ [Myxococcota bacterium]